MTLQAEFDARQGKPYPEILSEVRAITEDVVMPIEDKDLRDVVTVLASGLDYRLQMAEPSPLRSGLIRAFNSMSINEFGFNLADPVVAQMLDLGVSAGLVEVNERLWFYGIATKQVPKYPSVQLIDVVTHFEPALLDGQWHELPSTSAHTLVVKLTGAMPEEAMIEIEIQDQYQDGTVSDWYPNNALYGVHKAKRYVHGLQNNDCPRKVRWKCEYVITGTVSVE